MTPTEEEFVNEGFNAEELEALKTAPQEPEQVAEEQASEPLAAEPEQIPQEQKMVDVRALQEARAEIRKRDEELARQRTEQARLDERLKIINEALAKQNEPPAPKPPVFEDDPIVFYNHEISELKKQLDEFKQGSAQQQAQAAEEAKRMEIIHQADAVINTAIAKDPSLQAAVDHAFAGMRQDIQAEMDRRGIPVYQQNQVAQQWMSAQISELATKCPKDPDLAADFVMRHARFYGYGYGQPAAQQQQSQQATPEQLEQRQERHLSLSSIQGGEPPKQIDINALAKMSDSDFRALASKLGDKGLDKLMGAA